MVKNTQNNGGSQYLNLNFKWREDSGGLRPPFFSVLRKTGEALRVFSRGVQPLVGHNIKTSAKSKKNVKKIKIFGPLSLAIQHTTN